MNRQIINRLRGLFPQVHQGLAVLQRQENGAWEAQTRGGRPVRLYGQGYRAGQQVFYDTGTGRILALAPDIEIVDMAAE